LLQGSARLTLEFFADGLPKKKLQLIGISMLLILLSRGMLQGREVRPVPCQGAGRGGLVEEDADLLHDVVQDWPDPLGNEPCLLDPSAMEELKGGSTSRHTREREKAPPPAARRLSNTAASAPQREGEGIVERVKEDGEKR
jgi:hypothetical protein